MNIRTAIPMSEFISTCTFNSNANLSIRTWDCQNSRPCCKRDQGLHIHKAFQQRSGDLGSDPPQMHVILWRYLVIENGQTDLRSELLIGGAL